MTGGSFVTQITSYHDCCIYCRAILRNKLELQERSQKFMRTKSKVSKHEIRTVWVINLQDNVEVFFSISVMNKKEPEV